MAAKSPTLSLKSREIIGVDQFSQRREVFGKHDTVFLPQSPTSLAPASPDIERIITSNHGKTTANFKRNAPTYSSMRETKTDSPLEFRTRKYSDNFTSDLNQSDDDMDYRRSMTERMRRQSKLRREFLSSMHATSPNDSSFNRVGTRASMPVRSGPISYKIESPNLFKFPFAEPYSTPPPVRKVEVDLGPSEVDSGKENQDPVFRTKIVSLPDSESLKKIDHQKMFEELVKRYSPQRKPVDWKIPPTRPRIVDSVPKLTTSSVASADSYDSKKLLEDKTAKVEDDDVFDKKTETGVSLVIEEKNEEEPKDIIKNGPETVTREAKHSKASLTELAEKNDEVPELSAITRQLSKDGSKRPPLEKVVDLTIPDLLEKMTVEADDLEHKKDLKKVKRKRSFLDKLLGRNKKEKAKN